MSHSVGHKCFGCKETLFGLGRVDGQLVIFSNCLCNGPLGPRYRLLKDAEEELEAEEKEVTPEVTLPLSTLVH